MKVETLFLLFFIKHLICDFIIQFPRHYLNKGTYGRWGGIEHALIHSIGTYLISFNPIASLFDLVIHYHIDWAKMNINAHFGWKPDASEKFWWLLGFDQFAHYLTYWIIITKIL